MGPPSPPDPDPDGDSPEPAELPPEPALGLPTAPLPLDTLETERAPRPAFGLGLWLAAWAMGSWMLATLFAYALLPLSGPISTLVASLAGQGAGIGAAIAGLRLLQSLHPRRNFGIQWEPDLWAKVSKGLRVYLTSLPGLFLATLLVAGLEKWLHFPIVHPEIQGLFMEIKGAPVEVALFFLMATAGAPLFEEFVFRGLLYGTLRFRWRAPLSIVVTAVFFAAMHEPAGIFRDPRVFPLPIFYIGLVLGYVRDRTGSVYPGMAVHALNNGVALMVALTARGPL